MQVADWGTAATDAAMRELLQVLETMPVAMQRRVHWRVPPSHTIRVGAHKTSAALLRITPGSKLSTEVLSSLD